MRALAERRTGDHSSAGSTKARFELLARRSDIFQFRCRGSNGFLKDLQFGGESVEGGAEGLQMVFLELVGDRIGPIFLCGLPGSGQVAKAGLEAGDDVLHRSEGRAGRGHGVILS